MTKVLVLLADGFEDIEALTTVDLLRRANINVDLAAVKTKTVTASSGTKVICDYKIDDIKENNYDLLFLPGGSGVENLEASKRVKEIIAYFNEKEKYIAAICAAPSILGKMGLLYKRNFTCYPGYEKHIKNGKYKKTPLEISDHFITSRGIGYVFDFSLKLIELLTDKKTSKEVAKQTLISESKKAS